MLHYIVLHLHISQHCIYEFQVPSLKELLLVQQIAVTYVALICLLPADLTANVLQAHCTAPYKAPELFDVPSQCTIDERVDVWSLGCLL